MASHAKTALKDPFSKPEATRVSVLPASISPRGMRNARIVLITVTHAWIHKSASNA